MPRAKDEMPNTKHQIPHAHYESEDYQWQGGAGRSRRHQWRQTNPIAAGVLSAVERISPCVLGLRMRVRRKNKANFQDDRGQRAEDRVPKTEGEGRCARHERRDTGDESCQTKPICRACWSAAEDAARQTNPIYRKPNER